ncbi:hypothetical protein FND50_21330 [Rhodococcus sp. WB9]|uniref:hypothetical protein n=1 Tax=Rhodococcus sp. WB9 TaxID=2594007 RepID=UPI001185B2C5|nr:hypothetical protein [Rhodococcus sp. WB9]QDQ93045.1 hypothetical protein FND50_21330 [Rhodococcus sp. WB9]
MVDTFNTGVDRIGKTWAGWGNMAPTSADNYVMQSHRRMPDPLASLWSPAWSSVGHGDPCDWGRSLPGLLRL